MGVETATDLWAFVNPDEFGVWVDYEVDALPPAVRIAGLFDDPFSEVTVGLGVELGSSKPLLSIRQADRPEAKEGDRVIIDPDGEKLSGPVANRTYLVTGEPRQDGFQGMWTLELKRDG